MGILPSDAPEERSDDCATLTDRADVLMVVLVAIYLRNTEGDQLRGVLKGLLYGVVMLMIVMYCTLG